VSSPPCWASCAPTGRRWPRRAEGEEHSFDIDALNAAKLFQRHVEHQGALAADPGVGITGVDPVERSHRRGERGVDLRFVADVADERVHARRIAAFSGQRGARLLGFLAP